MKAHIQATNTFAEIIGIVDTPTDSAFVRAHGESMLNAGIMDGDLLVVDCSVPAEQNRIVMPHWRANLP